MKREYISPHVELINTDGKDNEIMIGSGGTPSSKTQCDCWAHDHGGCNGCSGGCGRSHWDPDRGDYGELVPGC